jgi:hypothetical protein
VSLRRLAVVLFGSACAASALALNHMNSLLALVWIAPGYLVQAWLFETGRALGGLGYKATMVGVSAVVWTLVIVGATVSVRYLLHRLRRRGAGADPGGLR